MALLTLADMQQEVWDTTGDADSANRTVDATTLTRLLNRFYSHVRGLQDDRTYLVTASVSGASLAPQAGAGFKLLTEVNYRSILEVYPAASNTATAPLGPALDRWEPWELFAMQVEDPTDRAIYASAYAVWRAGTATAASVGRWNFGAWPLSTVTYDYLLAVTKEVTALSGATDKPDTTEEETHYVCDMTSAVAARLIGRSEEEIAQILARLPAALQSVAAQHAKDIGLVTPRPGQEAA